MRYLRIGTWLAALALAGSFAVPGAAATTLPIRSVTSGRWAGYVGAARRGHTIKSVNVTITVPAVSCQHSVGPGSKGKLYPGWHASFWAGIDGWSWTKKPTNNTVEQAGIIAFCATKKSKATYRLFYEMFPAGPIMKNYVQAGKVIVVYVGASRSTYTFGATSVSGTTYFKATARCATGTKCRNSTAEVITEKPGGSSVNGQGMADTGTVSYANAAVSLSGVPYGMALAGLARLTRLTLSLKRHPRIVKPGQLTEPTGYSSFKTYWR
jgi:hypothetical protein